jgi:hypothetical protein
MQTKRGFVHPPTSTAEVEERVELYIYSPFWNFVACSKLKFMAIDFVAKNESYLGM